MCFTLVASLRCLKYLKDLTWGAVLTECALLSWDPSPTWAALVSWDISITRGTWLTRRALPSLDTLLASGTLLILGAFVTWDPSLFYGTLLASGSVFSSGSLFTWGVFLSSCALLTWVTFPAWGSFLSFFILHVPYLLEIVYLLEVFDLLWEIDVDVDFNEGPWYFDCSSVANDWKWTSKLSCAVNELLLFLWRNVFGEGTTATEFFDVACAKDVWQGVFGGWLFIKSK